MKRHQTGEIGYSCKTVISFAITILSFGNIANANFLRHTGITTKNNTIANLCRADAGSLWYPEYPTQKAQYHILLYTKYTPSHYGGDGVFVNRGVDIAI